MIEGYLFDREYFHASASGIACVLWSNISDKKTERMTLHAFDIQNNALSYVGDVVTAKCHDAFLPFFDKRKFPDDTETKVYCERSGEQTSGRKCDGKSYTNKNIIGYLQAQGYSIDAKHVCLTRETTYNIRGFYLRSDFYLKALPLFVSKEYLQENWYERDVYFNTSDGGDAYTHDPEFLKECLIYTCLSNQNKCLSFTGSDGRYYRNELTFDTTNGDTCASTDLEKFKSDPKTALDADEEELMELWNNLLAEAKTITAAPATPSDAIRKDDLSKAVYNPALTYGVYQITKELNTSYTVGAGSRKHTIYDHPNLNSYLTTLRDKLKAYYKSHITEKMFKYELLK